MNEITRIHLAKVPYNIEVEAKKELQKYLEAIEAYAGDSDLVSDVESRMVEILAGRKVEADGTIAVEDVKALKQQLGDPAEFSADGQSEAAPIDDDDKPLHRLYRDTTQSWLGGVAAGIARYYGIQAWWVRLIFIFLALVSFGSVALIYIILWVIIPPVRTAADLLQLEGRAATVTAIRTLNERGEIINTNRDHKVARFFSIFFGVLAALTAASVLIGMVTLGALMAHRDFRGITDIASMTGDNGVAWLVFGIVLGGMLLFVIFMSLVSYALISWRYTKRILISGLVVVVLGLLSLGVVAALVATSNVNFQQQIDRSIISKTYDLPAGFTSIDSLNIKSNGQASVTYVAGSGKPRIVVETLPGGKQPSASVNGSEASIAVNDSNIQFGPGRFYRQTSVKIYGPALSTIKLTGGVLTYDGSNKTAAKLAVNLSGDNSQLTIYRVQVDSLQADLHDQSAFDATGAAVREAVVNITSSGRIDLANIATLSLTTPDVCASDNEPVSVNVANVNSDVLSYNGTKINAKSFTDACVELTVGGQE